MKYRAEKLKFSSLGKQIIGVAEFPIRPTRRAVILSHGLTNSKSRRDAAILYDIRQKLLERGIMTFRFDYYGSGESEGQLRDKTISIMHANLRDAIATLRNKYPFIKRIGLCGKSIGANLIGLSGGDKHIQAYAFLTCPLSLNAFFGRLYKGQSEIPLAGAGVKPSGRIKGPFTLRKKYFLELTNIDRRFKSKLRKIKNAIVVVNKGDEKVTVENSWPLYDYLKSPKRLLKVRSHIHELKGHQAAVAITVSNFINRYL